MDPFATIEDLEAAWRPLTAGEFTSADYLLKYASSIIRARVPTVDDRITAATLDSDLVRQVTVAMVLRVMKNPQGLVEKRVGGVTTKLSDEAAAAAIVLLDDELALLAPRSGKAVFGTAQLGAGLGLSLPTCAGS